MGLSAVLLIEDHQEGGSLATSSLREQDNQFTQPLACIEIMGRPLVERTVENLLNSGFETITVLAPQTSRSDVPALADKFESVEVKFVDDMASGLTETLSEYAQNGIKSSLILSANLHVEADLRDFVYFHQESKQKVTQAYDGEGSLEMWVLNPPLQRCDIENLLASPAKNNNFYYVAGYVMHLSQASDIRQLITDGLGGVCNIRPAGKEVKTGIWLDEGADVDRKARIVAPAYIGRNSVVREDTLITRCSSIERDCHIDYGTVVEDSSILANTRIGIWLDVVHAVASGNKLISLSHEVTLEIPDPGVMRSNTNVEIPMALELRRREQLVRVADRQRETATPEAATEAWQLGANLIQG